MGDSSLDYDYDIRKIGICQKCGYEQDEEDGEIKMPCPKCGGYVKVERN